MSSHDDYTAEIKAKLDAMHASITELIELTKKRDSVTRSIFCKELQKLEHHCQLAEAKSLEVITASETQRDERVKEFERSFAAVKRSYHYFKTQI